MQFLIIKTSAFGDIVHAYPVIHFLKEHYKECQIDWVVEERMKELVTSHPLVDTVITINSKGSKLWPYEAYKKLKDKRYDVLFDLQGNCKSALIRMCAHAKEKVGFGFKSAPEAISSIGLDLRINVPKGQNIRLDYLCIAQSYAGVKKPACFESMLKSPSQAIGFTKDVWLICPGSRWPNKKLPKETLSLFLQQCQKRFGCSFVFLAGSDSEREEARFLSKQCINEAVVLDRPSMSLLQQAMNHAKLVIAMDSLPLHLAATTKTPTFSVFGASSGAKYAPVGAQHGYVQGTCPYGQTFEKRCKLLRTCKTGACIREMSADALFSQFTQFIDLLQI
jgi:heptosyltransferase-1